MRGLFKFIFIVFVVLSKSLYAYGAGVEGSSEFFMSIYLDRSCLMYGESGDQVGTNTSLIGSDEGIYEIKSGISAKFSRPLSTRVVECIDGTLSSLFLQPNARTKFTLFQEFQSVVKPLVLLALILYIAINGYLIITGQLLREKPKQEVLMFLIKFVLVFYFSIGDAWKDFFFVALRSVASTIGTILLEAGMSTVRDGCNFVGPHLEYPAGKEYIAFFDTLDCKFSNYMGWFRGRKLPILVPIGITFSMTAIGAVVFAIVFVFILQLITLAARIVQLYLTSIIILTLLIYASPIIVPFALFNYTKSMFDNWLNKILGLVVHPIMVFAFASILMSITDRIFYGNNPDDNDMFKPYTGFAGGHGTDSNLIFNSIASIFANPSTTSAQKQELLDGFTGGAEPDKNCYGGNSTSLSKLVPLVCIMIWLEGTYSVLWLPFPHFIEIIPIYLPYRIDLLLLLFFTLILDIILLLLLGVLFESLEGLIGAISGQTTNLGTNKSMLSTVMDGGKGGLEGAQNLQDQLGLRAKTNDQGKDGGGQNTNDLTGKGKDGGGQNTNDLTGGKGEGGADKASDAADKAGDAADKGSDAADKALDAT